MLALYPKSLRKDTWPLAFAATTIHAINATRSGRDQPTHTDTHGYSPSCADKLHFTHLSHVGDDLVVFYATVHRDRNQASSHYALETRFLVYARPYHVPTLPQEYLRWCGSY